MRSFINWVLTALAGAVICFAIWATPEEGRTVVLGGTVGFIGFALALGIDSIKRDLLQIRAMLEQQRSDPPLTRR
jgi:hypothetical protein